MRVMSNQSTLLIKKYPIQKVTGKNYLADGRRIKFSECDSVRNANTLNSIKCVAFEIWTIDPSKINDYKEVLRLQLEAEVGDMLILVQRLQSQLKEKINYSFRDYSEEVEIPNSTDYEFQKEGIYMFDSEKLEEIRKSLMVKFFEVIDQDGNITESDLKQAGFKKYIIEDAPDYKIHMVIIRLDEDIIKINATWVWDAVAKVMVEKFSIREIHGFTSDDRRQLKDYYVYKLCRVQTFQIKRAEIKKGGLHMKIITNNETVAMEVLSAQNLFNLNVSEIVIKSIGSLKHAMNNYDVEVSIEGKCFILFRDLDFQNVRVKEMLSMKLNELEFVKL